MKYIHQMLVSKELGGAGLIGMGHREDVPDLLRAADMFRLPSTSAGLPLSVLEAQATKTPVLAAPTAGIPERVRDGETGFLIPASDATGYAQRIKSLLNQPETYQYTTEKAHAKVTQDHNWQTYFENTLMVYQSLI
jgi:glycosyltransferase involved in cell wall biosynthesis